MQGGGSRGLEPLPEARNRGWRGRLALCMCCALRAGIERE